MLPLLPLLLSLCLLGASAIGHRRHFPQEDENGAQLTNEFQLVSPHNIVRRNSPSFVEARVAAAAGTVYEITDIFPLNINNDDVVTVEYYTDHPDKNDWIGAYSPADVDITTTVPVKYGWCDHSDTYYSTGKGSLRFNMTNLRADIAFYYFTGGTKTPLEMNQSTQVVDFINYNEQLRPRVVATGDPNLLQLLWSSNSNTAPTLKWGVSSGVYDNTVAASTQRIERSQMKGAPAATIGWRDLGLIHTANLIGMAALATEEIYYCFGDTDTDEWSTEHVLHLPPLAGTQPATRPTRVILYDDMGRGTTDDTYTWNEYGRPSINTTMAVAAEIEADTVDAVYHGGDISYATGYMAVWDFYMNMLSPVAGSVVYLTTVGNHESDCPNSATIYNVSDSGGECGIPTVTLLPEPAPAVTDAPWWSYDIGLIHFVGMSTEHNFSVGSQQYDWLEEDLSSVNRTLTPWVIFGGHRAMYINSNYGGTPTSDIVVMDNLIATIEPLIWKYKVNLAFWGHNHAVQRMTAVLNKQVIQKADMRSSPDGGVDVAWHDNPQATVHMVIGTAGAGFTVNYVTPYPDWCEMVFYRWGYAAVTAVNGSYLEWEWIDSSDGKVYDRMVITQDDPNTPFHINDNDDEDDDDKKKTFGLSYEGFVAVIISAFVFIAIAATVIYYYQGTTVNSSDYHLIGDTKPAPRHDPNNSMRSERKSNEVEV